MHQLSILIDEGKLVIFTSDRIHYHSKLYICHNENGARLINGSANFTRTGTGIKGRQWNDIWGWDITGDYVSSPIYMREISKYNIYKSNVEVFIEGDLASVFANEENEKKRVEMMENWLKTDMIHGCSGDNEVRELTRLINKRVMEGDAEVIEIMPPQSDTTVKRVAEDMAQLGIQLTGDSTIQVIRSDYLNHNARPFPMMDVDFDLREVRIGIGNEVINRTANDIDIDLMEQDIIRFEDFIDTVEMTDFRDLRLAKMSLFEAMLYIQCTPFHNEFMERRRRIFGIAEERGPRILHLWGSTYNGKSKFLNVASKFLTGSKIIKPRDAEHFVQKEVKSVQLMQTAYPQMYDDLTKDKWTADGTEKIVKTIWDKKWRPGDQQSQVILTSNRKCPDGQMKTRVKEIHFPATFERSKESRMALLQHLEGDCEFFTWFSKLYFDYAVDNPDYIEDDESFIGRIVIRRMYELCDRELPDWFCSEPLDHLYDKTAIEILKALARKDGWFREKSGEFQIIFREQIEWWEVAREYKNGIPEGEVQKYDQSGHLQSIFHVKDGMKQGEEWIYYSAFDNTDPQAKLYIEWNADVIEGITRTWYSNGILESEREISDNKKHGVSSCWYSDGSLMMIEEYENDQLHRGRYMKKGSSVPVSTVEKGEGTATLYDAKGIFLKRVLYKKGTPVDEL